LLGTKAAGWSDRIKVKVTLAAGSAKVGCPGDAPVQPGGGSNGNGNEGTDEAVDACKSDADCSHNTPNQGVVCDPAANGPGMPGCVDGCRKTADCAQGATCSSNDGKTLGTCAGAPSKLGDACKTDDDCSDGNQGTGRVCSTSTGKCVVGCHSEADCSKGATGGAMTYCDKSLDPYTCVTRKQLGDSCSSDNDCNGGVEGTQRVCNNAHVCDDACHSDADCQMNERCDKSLPTWKCGYDPKPGITDGCVLTYPSGVAIQGVKTPSTVKSEYQARGCALPFTCMIDVRDMKDANTGKTLSYNHVQLSAHFTLRELTATSAARSPYVFIDPELVTHLELTRGAYGNPIAINSGFRSAAHQAATCKSMCGHASCTNSSGSVTCALCSRHMAGTAADTKHSSPKCALAGKACSPGKFDFIYNEKAGGDHLHMEMKTTHPAKCVYQGISCQLGCSDERVGGSGW
jgi:hypothetical protein